MSRYLLIDLGAWSVPLLFTFGPFAPYDRKLGRVLAAFLTAGLVFIAWDVWATAEGHWGFASEHVMSVRLIGLPVEEVLFFLIIPYSSLFILANLEHYFSDRAFRFPGWLTAALSAGFLAAAVAFRNQAYTRTAMIACGAFFPAAAAFGRGVLGSVLFWIYMGISYIPFLVVNYLLTSPPIVWYNPAAIWGIRVTTIPLEDFFYSFAMLGFYTLVYRRIGGRGTRSPISGT